MKNKMKNWLRDRMPDAFRQTQSIPLWKFALLTLLVTVYSMGTIAFCIVVIFTSKHVPIDWAFVGIVTGGIVVLVILLALYISIKTWHWIDT